MSTDFTLDSSSVNRRHCWQLVCPESLLCFVSDQPWLPGISRRRICRIQTYSILQADKFLTLLFGFLDSFTNFNVIGHVKNFVDTVTSFGIFCCEPKLGHVAKSFAQGKCRVFWITATFVADSYRYKKWLAHVNASDFWEQQSLDVHGYHALMLFKMEKTMN